MKLLIVLSLGALVAAEPATYFQEAFDGGETTLCNRIQTLTQEPENHATKSGEKI